MALTDDRLEKSPRQKFKSRDLGVIALLGGVAAGASMFAATGTFVPSLVTAVLGAALAYKLTNNIPRNGA